MLKRILGFSLGLNGVYLLLFLRGGQDLIDVSNYLDEYKIAQGVNYLDSKRLRELIHRYHRKKIRVKVIYITASALCHIIRRYGHTNLKFIPDVLYMFEDLIGTSSLYHTAPKLVGSSMGGLAFLIIHFGGPISSGLAFLLGWASFRVLTDKIEIFTAPYSLLNIDERTKFNALPPRAGDFKDVVVINCRNTLRMSETPVFTQKDPGCLLMPGAYFNEKCCVIKDQNPNLPTPQTSNGIESCYLHNFKYDDVVNMRDVTGLDDKYFTDIFDLGIPESIIYKPVEVFPGRPVEVAPAPSAPVFRRIVNFLDTFYDPAVIPEEETWESSAYLRGTPRSTPPMKDEL